jgi:hypothetical protein
MYSVILHRAHYSTRTVVRSLTANFILDMSLKVLAAVVLALGQFGPLCNAFAESLLTLR